VQKAKEATERAEGLQNTRGGAKVARGRGRNNIARSRTSRCSKLGAEGADLRMLENAMSFMIICGMCSSKTIHLLEFILVEVIERTYGEDTDTTVVVRGNVIVVAVAGVEGGWFYRGYS